MCEERKTEFLLSSWQQSERLIDFISGRGEAALKPMQLRGSLPTQTMT